MREWVLLVCCWLMSLSARYNGVQVKYDLMARPDSGAGRFFKATGYGHDGGGVWGVGHSVPSVRLGKGLCCLCWKFLRVLLLQWCTFGSFWKAFMKNAPHIYYDRKHIVAVAFYRTMLCRVRLWDCMSTVRLSVLSSVTFRYRDHIRWNSSQIISQLNSLRPTRSLTPTWAVLSKIRVE